MKKILLIALSTLGLGGGLLALISKGRRQGQDDETDSVRGEIDSRRVARTRRISAKSDTGMSVKRDGSLAMAQHKPMEVSDATHLKKDGSPDRRYKENR